MSTLIIDGITVPAHAILEFDQEYETVSAESFVRTADGSGVLRTLWSGKLRTVISGKGWAPSALINLATGQSHTMKCAMLLSVDGANTSITIPSARRTDSGHTPIGYALIGDSFVETPIIDITDNVCTLTAVSGATAYRVDYWPELVVHIERNTSKGQSNAEHNWTIEAEEF